MLPTTKVLLGVLLLVAFVAAPSRTSELANFSAGNGQGNDKRVCAHLR
jgi:hypothetical protein